MSFEDTPRPATFARLIALGYPPGLAAKRAGYWNLRASRAATRLAPPPAVAAPRAPRAPSVKPETKAAETAPTPPPPLPPPLPPMLTEEEWLAEFGPMLRARAAARA